MRFPQSLHEIRSDSGVLWMDHLSRLVHRMVFYVAGTVRISGEHVYPSRSKVGILVLVILTLGVHLPFSNPFS